MRSWGFPFVLALAGGSSPAMPADNCTAPCIDYAISAELQDDWIFASNPSFLTSNNLEPTFEVKTTARPIDHFKLVTHATTEDVIERVPGADRAFNDIGSYVEELYGEIDFEPVGLRAGKFNPLFGRATEVLDGIADEPRGRL
jgi:hypothetical protein